MRRMGRAGLDVELPENLGARLTSYWARLEEEVALPFSIRESL
jgi:hypothetical protein